MPASNGTARPLSQAPNLVPGTQNGSPPSAVRNASGSVSQSSDGRGQSAANAAYVQDFVLRLSSCSTIGEALKLLPVPVQPDSRGILDGVFQAAQKLGGAEALLLFWQDKLRQGIFDGISQLNSLKAPVVQISKEAIGPDDGGLGAMDLTHTLHKVKEISLKAMIAIKEQEVTNLRSFVQPQNIRARLAPAWENVVSQQAATITSEHHALLSDEGALRRVCQVAASIGESSSHRARIAKDKRTMERREADIDMTDVSSGSSKKQLASVVEEVLKRREQSRRDRAQAGKGKRSSGTSNMKKKKTQKEQTKKKRGPGKNKRKGPNSSRPPSRR